MTEKLLLIDGYSILRKAFYGLPSEGKADTVPVNAVYGFLNLFFHVMQEYTPAYVAAVLSEDAMDQPPEEFKEQLPVLKKVLDAMQISTISAGGRSAADVLNSASSDENGETLILTGDRRLLQAASQDTMVLIPVMTAGKAQLQCYHAADVQNEFMVVPAQWPQLRALAGDPQHAVCGIPGMGERAAARLLQTYGSVSNACAHADELEKSVPEKHIPENAAALQHSIDTETLQADLPLTAEERESWKTPQYLNPETYTLLEQLGMKDLLKYFDEAQTPQQKGAEIHEVTELAEAEALFQKIMKYAEGRPDRFVGFAPIEDSEDPADFIGLSLAFETENSYLVRPEGLITAGYLGDWLQKLSAGCRLSACDIKDSYHLFTPYEVDHQEEWTSSFDILLAAYLLNPLKNDYDPEDIAAEHLELTMKGRAQRFGKNRLKDSDPKEVLAYAGELSQVCLKAAPVLEKKLADEEMLTLMRRIEMPLTYVLYDMQRVGIIVRRDELKEYGDQLTGRIGELEQHIHEEAGSDFNINSPKQLGEILFEQMQIPGGKKTKSGYSTAADVLEKLAPDYPFVADILEYRGLTKLKSTYADGLADYIGSDNRIHTTYHQTITATGRISSTDPNLQNIPMRTELGRMIRKVFVPQEGYLFSDADYSQIELRILAHMSGDKELIAAYHEGRDIHRITASKVFHTPFAEVTPLQRRNAKAVNFGIVYGISAFGLSNDLNISRSEAKEYMDQYLKTYPGVRKYQEEAVALAKERGYAITMFGRRRPMPELKASNFMQRQFGERVAMNAPIQGTAADIMKIGMLRVFRRIRKEKLHSRLILQIHDELVVETAPDELKQIEDILTQEMTGAADLAVPLDVDCHSGSDWFEAKG